MATSNLCFSFPLVSYASLHANVCVLTGNTPEWFVDVRDTADIHLAALTSSTLAAGGARIWAAAGPFNINDVLKALRNLYPKKTFPDDVEGIERDLSRIDNKRGGELLGGWRSLEDAVRANTEDLV